MPASRLPGGPTQDEIMAVSLFKLGLRNTDTVLEIGCGTGKVTVALAMQAGNVFTIDRRSEAVSATRESVQRAGLGNVGISCTDAITFLAADRVYDCAFLGGTKQLAGILPVLAKKVRRTIVINAVLVSTLNTAIVAMQRLGIFREAVQVQAARSHQLAGSIMFRPVDPVYIIVGSGTAC